jgi:hypothetical protein
LHFALCTFIDSPAEQAEAAARVSAARAVLESVKFNLPPPK